MNDKTDEKEINPVGPMVLQREQGELAIIDPVAMQRQHNMRMTEIALESGAGMEVLEKMMDLQERWEAGIARKSFYQALPQFQSKIPVIVKSGLASFPHKNGGGYTEYSFAKLEDITEAIKPLLEEFNMSYRFEQATGDKQLITITCVVTHSDGHEERTSMSGYPDQSGSKNNMQQAASTVSYLRRYTLTGALGITVSDEDDDAASAGDQAEQTEQQGDFYPEDTFNGMFPAWKLAVESGSKTTNDILQYLKGKNVNLSTDQINKINNIGQ